MRLDNVGLQAEDTIAASALALSAPRQPAEHPLRNLGVPQRSARASSANIPASCARSRAGIDAAPRTLDASLAVRRRCSTRSDNLTRSRDRPAADSHAVLQIAEVAVHHHDRQSQRAAVGVARRQRPWRCSAERPHRLAQPGIGHGGRSVSRDSVATAACFVPLRGADGHPALLRVSLSGMAAILGRSRDGWEGER